MNPCRAVDDDAVLDHEVVPSARMRNLGQRSDEAENTDEEEGGTAHHKKSTPHRGDRANILPKKEKRKEKKTASINALSKTTIERRGESARASCASLVMMMR